MEFAWWFTWSALVLPALAWLIWSWNELRYVVPVKARIRKSGKKLPPGSMGLPFFGELFTFLWYFKVLRRPDDFINSKRRRLKRFVTAAVNQPKALHKMALLIQPRIVAALGSWADRKDITALDEVKQMTFQYIGKLFASLEPGPLLDEVSGLFNGLLIGFRAQPFNIPGTAYNHALKCRNKLVEIFRAELERRKRRQKEWTDLMDELMQIEDENGNRLSDEEVVDNIVSLISGGFEPITTACTWAFYYLAFYPHVLHKLREENMAISKKKNGELITNEDVSNMKYTSKVIEEILRITNVAAFVFRSSDRDVEYQGHMIPKGWKVIVWLRYATTDPRNFAYPMCFNPDRWNEPAILGSFQVFGGGSRICAADMLARMQIAIFLHHLCIGYKWELKNPDVKTTYLPHTRPSDGMKIALSRV